MSTCCEFVPLHMRAVKATMTRSGVSCWWQGELDCLLPGSTRTGPADVEEKLQKDSCRDRFGTKEKGNESCQTRPREGLVRNQKSPDCQRNPEKSGKQLPGRFGATRTYRTGQQQQQGSLSPPSPKSNLADIAMVLVSSSPIRTSFKYTDTTPS